VPLPLEGLKEIPKVTGGKLYRTPPSVHDPTGECSWVVVCEKHPSVRIRLALSVDSDLHILDTAYKALDQCSYCLAEREPPPTRFPEGAEL